MKKTGLFKIIMFILLGIIAIISIKWQITVKKSNPFVFCNLVYQALVTNKREKLLSFIGIPFIGPKRSRIQIYNYRFWFVIESAISLIAQLLVPKSMTVNSDIRGINAQQTIQEVGVITRPSFRAAHYQKIRICP